MQQIDVRNKDNSGGKNFVFGKVNKIETLNILLAKTSQEKLSLVKKLNASIEQLSKCKIPEEKLVLEKEEKSFESRIASLEDAEQRIAKSIQDVNSQVNESVPEETYFVTDTIHIPENIEGIQKFIEDESPLKKELQGVIDAELKNNFIVAATQAEKVSQEKEKVLTEAEKKAQELLEEWGIDARTSFREEYQKRLLNTDYFSAFKLLTVRINAIPDEEDKQELEDFFYNYKEVLRKAAEKDLINKYAIYMADFVSDVTLSKENKEFLTYLFPIGAMSLCFSALVSGGALSKATVLKPYINNNLNAYPNVLRDLIAQNKIESLEYLLDNTTNLHFNNNEIMNLLMGLSSYEKIYELFEKYDFNINAKLSVSGDNIVPEWNTLFAKVISSLNYPLFEKILDNTKQDLQFSVLFKREQKIKNYSVFYLIHNENEFSRFVNKALDYKDINNTEINCILSLLMQNPQILMNSINNGLVDKIFNHPNLNNVSFIEGTVHLFGFLSCADYWCQSNLRTSFYDSLRYLLERFLNRFPDVQDMPTGLSFNVYGSTVYLLAQNTDAKFFTLLQPILYHYRAWINIENPCGKTPIELVPKNNEKLRNLLLNLGAVERKVPLLTKFAFWKKNNKPQIDFTQKPQFNNNQYEYNQQQPNLKNSTSNEDVEAEMRESFNRIRPTLKKVPLDIRLACEDLFLNAEALLVLTAQAEKGKFNEDVFMLIQTFNDYLPSILDTYVGSLDLNFIQNPVIQPVNNQDKDEVLKQIGMLNTHINKLRENIELKMKKNLNMDIKRNTEFLKERLGMKDDETSQQVLEIDSLIKKDKGE